MRYRLRSRFALFLPLATASCWLSSCAAALGPGYSIESQEIRIQFEPAPEPKIHVDASYQLRNNGNQPLTSIELRLPGRRTFRFESSQTAWDDAALTPQASSANARETLFDLPKPWNVSERHKLHLYLDFLTRAPGDTGLSFTSDAFFLPSEGWAPELLPSRGFFASGGVPPKQWSLSVRAPAGFLIHTSGRSAKTSRHGSELTLQAVQTTLDRYPFVVAGAYTETEVSAENEKAFLWTRKKADPLRLRQSVEGMAAAVRAYDRTFGNRPQNAQPLWIVECPVASGCFTAQQSSYATLLSAEPDAASSELASADTLMMDFSTGSPNLAAAAPSLAATWLGYGQNPGFYEQDLPVAALPAFASALGYEAASSPAARNESIRHALQLIPETNSSSRKPESQDVLRAKSFLFFYALQDRYGEDVFRRAINHMLSARRGRGFNLDDLIAAFEQETHENVAEFVRLWMKHPGVPGDFRARYQNSAVAFEINSKEIVP